MMNADEKFAFDLLRDALEKAVETRDQVQDDMAALWSQRDALHEANEALLEALLSMLVCCHDEERDDETIAAVAQARAAVAKATGAPETKP